MRLETVESIPSYGAKFPESNLSFLIESRLLRLSIKEPYKESSIVYRNMGKAEDFSSAVSGSAAANGSLLFALTSEALSVVEYGFVSSPRCYLFPYPLFLL